jgi:hypothetical protein
MRDEFHVECYLKGSAGAVKLSELACDRTDEARARLAHALVTTYRPEDADKIELRARNVTAEDVKGVAAGLSGALEDAWWAACRTFVQ